MLSLKSLIIFTRNVNKSIGFYTQGMGLKCELLSEELAELSCENSLSILLIRTDSSAYTRCGFSPILTWEADNFEERLTLMLKYGAISEGSPAVYNCKKVVYLQSPDGFSINLIEKQEELPVKAETEEHPVDTELKKLFQKLRI